MKAFMDEDFLLSTEPAKTLYHNYAEKQPIIDYHCHISPKEIAEDLQYDNITQVWLGGDHYKWRLLRANGIPEDYITGNAPDREKFQAWAETLEKAIGNPIYHWTHLELKRYFGYDGILNGRTAEEVWNLCNQKLRSGFGAREMIVQSNVQVICTTDDPADDLRYHQQIAESGFDVKVLPAFRPDRAVNLEKPDFTEYIHMLGQTAGREIRSFQDLLTVMEERLAFFDRMGCRVSDHGLGDVPFCLGTDAEADAALKKALAGEPFTEKEAEIYKTRLILFCARAYAKRGWVMQIHYGALRNTNTRAFRSLGPDTGFDAIADTGCIAPLSGLLDTLAQTDELPKTILYSLNPNDNRLLQVIAGGFQDGKTAGKIQHGAAWWFNDTKQGMEAQLSGYAETGLLANFVGMLTDSRSFLSYTRHEYFRRILCNLIGQLVENGEYPSDMETLGRMITDISYQNAEKYFAF
ncbi:MAG TPA: glucuronate isomerase [Firmicutes bacterium]|nr:glucuronate isomerase [Bacillota bacterium]